jgi:hypothetical protein
MKIFGNALPPIIIFDKKLHLLTLLFVLRQNQIAYE